MNPGAELGKIDLSAGESGLAGTGDSVSECGTESDPGESMRGALYRMNSSSESLP